MMTTSLVEGVVVNVNDFTPKGGVSEIISPAT